MKTSMNAASRRPGEKVPHPCPVRALITRPRRDGMRFAADLKQRGIEAIIAPILKFIPLPPPGDFMDNLGKAQALLFTSANGVRAFPAMGQSCEKPVLAVGAATAAAARQAGFRHITSAAGDTADLADRVIERLDPLAGPLFHATAAGGDGTLSRNLRQAGFTVHRRALYAIQIAPHMPRKARLMLLNIHKTGDLAVGFFFSPRSSAAFVTLVKDAALQDACPHMAACALSAAAAAPLQELAWRDIIIAKRPESTALVDAFAQWYTRGHTRKPALTPAERHAP